MVNSVTLSYFHSYLVSFSRYAPALRQLRQVAFLVAFPSTIPSRLATRLLEVILSFISGSTFNIRCAAFLYQLESPCLCFTETLYQFQTYPYMFLISQF